jgi:diphthamide biosynthesis protein 7
LINVWTFLELILNLLNREIVHTIPTDSAILDVHFPPTYLSPSIFGVATSTGSLEIYQLIDDNSKPFDSIENITATPRAVIRKTIPTSPDTLITAFSWHPTEPAIGMTLSTGSVYFVEVNIEESSLPRDVGMHDLEAWTCNFMPDGTSLLSGGDDSALNLWELQAKSSTPSGEGSDFECTQPPQARWKDAKIHGAGVTAILPLDSTEKGTIILTGSYDDHIRLIHASPTGRRKVLTEMYLGGGVWRLKRIDIAPPPTSSANMSASSNLLLLASCMHAGARILRLTCKGDEDWEFEVLAKFEEHKSMNYGSDCQSGVNEKGQRTFITTSFYDRLLCLWRF